MSDVKTSQDNCKKPLFRELNADDPDPETTEIESLCVNCCKNGITKLLLTKIPFYKDVVVMSFSCDHCGYENNEVQPTGKVADKGIRITLEIQNQQDLNRQVIKSDYTSIKIPHLDFEIPSRSQKGEVTTIEGIIDRAITALKQNQDERRIEYPDIAKEIDIFIDKLKSLKDVKDNFTMIIEDVSGNSFIQNPRMPQTDPNCSVTHFVRTKEENYSLGIYEDLETNTSTMLPVHREEQITLEDLQSEVLQFPTNCPSCSSPCQTNMKVTKIPYFKEVVIMATTCDTCGHKTNEVKSGGGIETQGLLIEVKVESAEDFSRDILKSDTCSVQIPELDLEVGATTLGGKFTTIEGLLTTMRDQLQQQTFAFNDSCDPSEKIQMDKFLEKFNSAISGELPIRLILDDPAGNSYVQSFNAPDPDPRLKISRYERTFEQNEDLGLNDIKTENY